MPSVFNTQEGTEYVSENGNGDLRSQFKKMYNEAPEESLRMFNSPIFRMRASKDEGVRRELVDAMGIVRNKMDSLKDMFNIEGEFISVSKVSKVGRAKSDRIILDIPDSMKEYQGEIKEMFRAIKGSPWSWDHVKEDYLDEVDAFNGYMRGEFDLSGDIDGQPRAQAQQRNHRGRIKAVAPISETPLLDDSNLVDADKEKELKLLIQQEEAGTLDQEGFNAMEQALSDKLDRVREGSQKIRDRAAQPNNGGKPLSPIPDISNPNKENFIAREPAFPTIGKDLNIGDLREAVDLLTPKEGEQASDFLIKDEGYSASLPANVPDERSGITVGGLDIANGDERSIKKALGKVFDGDKVRKIMKASPLKGDKAVLALENIEISLTDEDIKTLQESYIKSFVVPSLKGVLGDSIYKEIPKKIRAPLEALTFLNLGPVSLKSLKKAFKTGKIEDFNIAINNYENYWNNQSVHNQARSQRVADAIREYRDNQGL